MSTPPGGSIGGGPPGGWLNIGVSLQAIAQNIIQAVTELQQLMPSLSSGHMSADTLVTAGFVRVLGISVTVAGSPTGFLHDAATLATAGSTNDIYAIPSAVGFYPVQLICQKGLVYKPGTGEHITVFYGRS